MAAAAVVAEGVLLSLDISGGFVWMCLVRFNFHIVLLHLIGVLYSFGSVCLRARAC
jgi:hypothetical protein